MALSEKLNKKDREELANRIQQDYQFAKGERDELTTDWEKARDQYNAEFHDLKKQRDDENLDQFFFVPKTRQTIHRIECSCVLNFFGTEHHRLFDIGTRLTNPIVGAAAKVLDKLIHAKIDSELDPRRAMFDSWHTGFVEGQGILKGGWTKEGTGRATLIQVPNEHVCWDPFALQPDDITFFVHERWLTARQLWERQENGIFEGVEEIVNGSGSGQYSDRWRRSVRSPGNAERVLYKIIEYCGPQQLAPPEKLEKMHREGEHPEGENIVCTIGDQDKILRLDKNTYADFFDNPSPFETLPYWIVTPLPKTNDTYGHSLALWLRPIQMEINLMRNQRRQAVDMEMTRKIFYDQTRLTNLKRLYSSRYGGTVPTDGPPRDVVYDFAPNTSTGNMVNEEMMGMRDMEDLSGVNAYNQAQTRPGMQKTATGVQIVTSEGNVKMDTLMTNIGLTGLIPVGKFFSECVLEMMTKKDMQKTLGAERPPPQKLKKVLGGDYRVEVKAGRSATSKDMQLRQLQHAANTFAQIGQAAPEIAKPALIEITEKMMPLLGQSDLTRFFGNVKAMRRGMERAGAEGQPGSRERVPSQAVPERAMTAGQGRQPTPEETPTPAGV